MVREARFSWDEDDPFRPLDRPDRFDDLDDLDVDPLIPQQRPSAARQPTDPEQRTERRRVNHKQNTVRSVVSDDRRHLAGADWLSDPADRDSEDD